MKEKIFVKITDDCINYQVIDFIVVNEEVKALLKKPDGKIIIKKYQELTVVG